jgi:two-component system sensor histidine kinase DegS
MIGNDNNQITNSWEELRKDTAVEIEQSQRALREIQLMLEQSQVELSKLTQRNASITAHLQQIQDQFDSIPRADIRMAYDSALDAQQRLFVMRGQLEKLQSDQTHLTKYIEHLKRLQQLFETELVIDNKNGGRANSGLEMVITAQETERKNLSRQMHDGPAQTLSNFILQTEIALRLFDIDQSKAREELNNLKSTAMSTFTKIRNFIFELRPMMLDDLGLFPTVKRYVETFQEQTGIETNVLITGSERRMESYIEVMIFRAIQELLSNVAHHAEATKVKVQINLEDNNIKVIVDDNGKGFEPDSEQNQNGIGLKIIKERVEMIGGSFMIDSVLAQGTRISFHVPITKNH